MSAEPNPFCSDLSPVKPLGVVSSEDGHEIRVVDFLGNTVALKAGQLGKNVLIAVCGGSDWLQGHFPQYERSSVALNGTKLVGFDQPNASAGLIIACCRCAKAAKSGSAEA